MCVDNLQQLHVHYKYINGIMHVYFFLELPKDAKLKPMAAIRGSTAGPSSSACSSLFLSFSFSLLFFFLFFLFWRLASYLAILQCVHGAERRAGLTCALIDGGS